MIYRFSNPEETSVLTPSGETPLARFLVEHSDDPGGPPSIDAYADPRSLKALQADLVAAVDEHAKQLRIAIVGTSDETLLQAYRNKFEKCLAGEFSFVAAEAANRQDAAGNALTAEALGAIIIAKGIAWSDGGQAIEAAKGAHKTAIAKLNSIAAADGYDVTRGWPA